MLRKIFYLLPPYLRYALRWIIYLPQDLFSKKKELAPPARLIYTGRGNFINQGNEWMNFFKNQAGVKSTDHVLDIGSGIGRIALPLTHFLIKRYIGFDAVKTGVDWCIKNITSRYPHFEFHYFHLHNDLYNDDGLKASQFVFPFDLNDFDFACAISVFTHMLPDEIKNYFYQMARVLKPGATAVCTFFVLNENTIMNMDAQKSSFKFILTDKKDFALMDKKVKSANVAYHEKYLEDIITSHTFEIIIKIPGHWCGREKKMELAFQDIWVIRRKE